MVFSVRNEKRVGRGLSMVLSRVGLGMEEDSGDVDAGLEESRWREKVPLLW